MELRSSWALPEEVNLREEDIKVAFRGFARGEGLSGWPMNLLSDWKSVKVFLTKKEIVIVFGWGFKDTLRIPTNKISSVSYEEHRPLIPIGSAPNIYTIKSGGNKEIGIRFGSYPTSYPTSENSIKIIKEFFGSFIRK